MPNLTKRQWMYAIFGLLTLELFLFGGIISLILATSRADTPSLNTPHTTNIALSQQVVVLPTVNMTPLVWGGPPPTMTPSPTIPPTPLATPAFSDANFTSPFVPTTQPRAATEFDLNYEGLVLTTHRFTVGFGGKFPEINQLLYPEPFFPPGYNNACGPVGLYAALKGLRLNVTYQQVRNIAVNYGFGAHGISTTGMLNTAAVLNNQRGQPLHIEQSRHYQVKDLNRLISRGSAVIVLVRVQRVNGEYRVTGDRANSFGHFIVVERINTLGGRVRIAGSTLGMQNVPLHDFLSSWSSSPPEPRTAFVPRFTMNLFDALEQTAENQPQVSKPTSGGGWAMALRRQ